MKVVIDIPEEEYEECKIFVDLVKQEGVLIDNLSTALKIHVANGTPLDKIRGKISLEKLGYPPSADYYKAIMKVLQIIDKYKAESEDEQ